MERTILLKYLKIWLYIRCSKKKLFLHEIEWKNNGFLFTTPNKYIDLKIILLEHQINYVEMWSMMSNVTKSFDILIISLSVLFNYFDGPIKLCIFQLTHLNPHLNRC